MVQWVERGWPLRSWPIAAGGGRQRQKRKTKGPRIRIGKSFCHTYWKGILRKSFFFLDFFGYSDSFPCALKGRKSVRMWIFYFLLPCTKSDSSLCSSNIWGKRMGPLFLFEEVGTPFCCGSKINFERMDLVSSLDWPQHSSSRKTFLERRRKGTFFLFG